MIALIAALYLGLSGDYTLPQGGSGMDRVGGAVIRAGSYVSDYVAFEGEVGQVEDLTSLAARGVFHFCGWSLYDRFFGFSQFDPFVTLGAKGWLGDNEGQVGPEFGVGSFYHLDDHWSMRFDANTVLGLDCDEEMVYTIALGLQYEF